MIRTAHWFDLTLSSINVIAAIGMVSALSVVAWLSWGVVRTDSATGADVLRGYRGRALGALWITVAVLVITAVPRELHAVSLGLPVLWRVGTNDTTARAYVLLLLGGYVALPQVLLGVALMVRKRGRAEGSKSATIRSTDLGTALVGTVGLLPSLLVLLASGISVYVQILAHSNHAL